MFDFLRNSHEFHPKGMNYSNNVRYVLAKKKVDELFFKWISSPQTSELLNTLVEDVKNHKMMTASSLNPLFTPQKPNLQASMLNSITKTPVTPPRSPQDMDKMRKSLADSSNSPSLNPLNKNQSEIFSDKSKFTKEPQSIVSIPKFYFPEGKPIDSKITADQQKIIDEHLPSKDQELQVKDFSKLCSGLCGLPEFLTPIMFSRIDTANKGKISKASFLKYWNAELSSKDPVSRCFTILKSPTRNYIEPEDFKPMMKILLESHPGLEFLQSTPEFQERYADTVIHRIFYHIDKSDTGKLSSRDFKRSNFFQILKQVDKEEDINKVREFFSYEHFYVLYCKFWELDTDHDFLISRDDFSRYSAHSLSHKVVDRIFSQIPRKFKSTVAGKMSYEDFIWFMLSEEDKTTETSIQYWFKVIDIDDNGIITGAEMEFFYEEQRQRQEYLNHEPVFFHDFLCQMVDLLKPEDDIKFKLEHFKKNRQVCGIFFTFLTNLNKLVGYEQRDPFMIKHDLDEHPDYNDWDRYAQSEYLRLAMEEENQENTEMFEGVDWDSDHEEQILSDNPGEEK